jgi:hypothetical protein
MPSIGKPAYSLNKYCFIKLQPTLKMNIVMFFYTIDYMPKIYNVIYYVNDHNGIIDNHEV